MKYAVSPAVMRQCDRQTIDSGTSAAELLARAGKAIYKSYPWRGKVGIVCGTGNNGGDGYVLALCLKDAGIPCEVILWQEKATAEGKLYLDRVRAAGIPVHLWQGEALSGYTEIADGLFGNGFYGVPDLSASALIRAINESGATVVGIDIPSGLSGLSGQKAGACVRADATIVMGALKYGNLLGCAKDLCGKVTVCGIGITVAGEAAIVPEIGDFAGILFRRMHDSHKGTYGYVTLLGGCRSFSGAEKLSNIACTSTRNALPDFVRCGDAALRSGCGVVRLAVPASVAPLLGQYVLESTVFPLPETKDGSLSYDPDAIDRALYGTVAAAVGMGWGTDPAHERILAHILSTYRGRLLIDADGLNALSRMGEEGQRLLRNTAARVVLTPHPKEFERISGVAIADMLTDPVRYAREYAASCGATVLLKGTATVITDGAETYIVDRGCPGMATAGSGDVLSGILAGLLGYHDPTPGTIACGAFIAGLAGEMAQAASNPISQTAGDTASKIPAAITEIMRASGTLCGIAESNGGEEFR